jgi:hypothetical protein
LEKTIKTPEIKKEEIMPNSEKLDRWHGSIENAMNASPTDGQEWANSDHYDSDIDEGSSQDDLDRSDDGGIENHSTDVNRDGDIERDDPLELDHNSNDDRDGSGG